MSDITNGHLILDESSPVKVLQCAATTQPKGLAGSIAEEFRIGRNHKLADGSPAPFLPNISLHAMGHGAVGQAIKAATIVNGLLVTQGIVLTILPSFEDKQVHDEHDSAVSVMRTVMRLRLIIWRIGG